ncbi:PLDc N-terminal domain-containing protein [Paenibacillus faecalis]|uniref:PLDc N-terminal domain-containing protein n=1 Tax=Paenibacillus faecalis TaxID=2079532 RepID=UPI000D0F3057|nr:PLDc N-terminal domain-containing protein [Paenibacillus faecalis]
MFAMAALVLPLLFLILHIGICVWGYRDAKRRGKSSEYALIVLVLLLFFPIVGIIVYFLIRD